MAKTRKKPTVPDQNPYEVPLYTPADVARYLRISVWSIGVLTGRHHPWSEPEYLFHHFWRYDSRAFLDEDLFLIPGVPEERIRIPFRRFATLFVRAGVLQALAEWPSVSPVPPDRRENLHKTVWRGLEDTRNDPVPFDTTSAEERVKKTAEPFVGRTADERFAALVVKHLTVRFERVESADGLPVRIYPPSRETPDATRIIALDPKVRFGRPTLAGCGLPTDVLFERYQAGDSVAELVSDYDITTGQAEEAIRYESKRH